MMRKSLTRPVSGTARLTALLLTLAALAAGPAVAAPADLKALYDAALQDNPTLRRFQFEVERARANTDLARSRRGLQVQATATASGNNFRDGAAGERTYGGQRLGLQARLPLYDPASDMRVDAGKATEVQREHETAAARSLLAGELLDHYLDALAAQDNSDALGAESTAALRHVDRLRALRERQMARVNDLAEAEAYVQTLNARRVDADSQRTLALARLREMSGIDVDAVLPLRMPPVQPDAGELAAWLQTAHDAHPRLLALRQAVDEARLQADAARADGAPQLAATFSHVWSDQGFDNRSQPRYRATALGLELRVPLYDAGRVDAGLREALARLGVAAQTLEEARRAIDREIRMHWLGAAATRARIQATGAEADALAQTVVAQERAMELGAARVTDVLDARRRLLRARSDQAQARYDHLRELAALRLRVRPVDGADINEWAGWFAARP